MYRLGFWLLFLGTGLVGGWLSYSLLDFGYMR